MQVNKIETTKKLKMLELQAEMLKTSKKKYDITDKEVSNLAADTRYVSPSHCLRTIRNDNQSSLIHLWLFRLQGIFIGGANVCAVSVAASSRWTSI